MITTQKASLSNFQQKIFHTSQNLSAKNQIEKILISPKKHAKNINKVRATDKNIFPLANWYSNLIFNYTDGLETDTNKKTKLRIMLVI